MKSHIEKIISNDGVYYLMDYDSDRTKDLLLRIKDHPDYELSSFISFLFVKSFCEECPGDIKKGFDFVTVPPSSKEALEIRNGYYLPYYFAKSVAGYLNIPFFKKVIYRTQETEAQKFQSVSGRILNIHNKFAVSEAFYEKIEGKNIMVLDDVSTTGSTINEAKRVLLEAGAAFVKGGAICSPRGKV